MTTGEPGQNPTGEYVGKVLRAVRTQRGFTLRELSAQIETTGHKMSHTTISQLETGNRRMTVEDLFVLAVALNVSPVTFLMPRTQTPFEEVELTGVGAVPARSAYWWITGQFNLGPSLDYSWLQASRPPWALLEEDEIRRFEKHQREADPVRRRRDLEAMYGAEDVARFLGSGDDK